MSSLSASESANAIHNAKDGDVFILSAKVLKTLKHKHHKLQKKTYILIRNIHGNVALYCIDKAPNKYLREIKLDKKFTAKIAKIAPNLLTEINSVPNHLSLNNASSINDRFPKIIDLVTSYEKVNFIQWRGKGKRNKMLAGITEDTYILIKPKGSVYHLYYYLADKKIKLPLLTYDQQDRSYQILLNSPQFAGDRKLYDEVCITKQGLDNFVDVLRGRRKQTLHQQLKCDHTPKPELNVYQQAKIVAANVKKHVDEVFEQILDPESYQEFLVAAPRDERGRYILPASANHTMVRYQRLNNLLINLQDFLEKCSNAHELLFEANNSLDLIASSRLLYQAYSAWAISYSELYSELTPLGVIPFLQNLATSQGRKDELGKFIPINTQLIQDQLHINPFYVSFTDDSGSWQNILQGAEEKLKALQNILNDLHAKLPKEGEASETIRKTMDDISIILAASTQFSNSPRKLTDVIKLVYKVYPTFFTLLKGLPGCLVALNASFKDYFLMTAQQVNLIFCDIVVNLDQIEIQLHLKQHSLSTLTFADMRRLINKLTPTVDKLFQDLPTGVIAIGAVIKDHLFMAAQLANVMFHDALKRHNVGSISFSENDSLQSLLQAFNNSIEATGYRFLNQQRFPYYLAILDNRHKLLAAGHDDNTMLRARIEDSLASHVKQINHSRVVGNRHQYYEEYRINAALRAISERIIALQTGKNKWFASSGMRDIKIFLLCELARKIPRTSSVDIALDELGSENAALRQRLHLLWEGQTGAMLRKIVNENQISNNRILDIIDIEIDRLKTDRTKRQFWFNAARKATTEENILALQKFKKAMLKPGFRLTFALDELNASYPKDYQVLVTKQKLLLKELQNIDACIPKDNSKARTINFLAAKPQAPQLTEHQIFQQYGYAIEEISERIEELRDEYDGSFSQATKAKKIILLNELKSKLLFGQSVDEALTAIANDDYFKDFYYLLHEGRTGKMLRKIEYAQTTFHDQMQYLEVQILRLHRLRSKPYAWLETRAAFLEERIYALSELKRLMQDHPEHWMSETMALLSPADRKILTKYENTALNNLELWQQAKREQEYFQSTIQVPVVNVEVVEENNPPSEAVVVVAPVPDNKNVYAGIIDNLANVQTLVGNLYKEILDPGVYAQFFENVEKDNVGKFNLNTGIDEPYWVHQYKQFYNFLISAGISLKELAKVHVPIMEFFENSDWLSLVKDVPWGIWDLMHAYKDFYIDLDQLDILPFLEKLTSGKEIKKILLDMLPVEASVLGNQLQHNALMLAIQQQDARWLANVDELNQKLDSIQEALLHLEENLPAGVVVGTTTKVTIEACIRLIKETRKFAAAPSNYWRFANLVFPSSNFIMFVYTIYPFVLRIVRNYPQAYAATNIVCRDQFLKAVQQLNLILREMMVRIDKFKQDAFLKNSGAYELTTFEFRKGMSISKLLEAFNTLVNNMGYQFKPDEAYPYTLTRLERERMLVADDAVKQHLSSLSIKKLVTHLEMQREEKILAHETKALEIKTQKNDAVSFLIDQRVSELEAELSNWFASKSVKKIKIKLLNQLKVFLNDHSVDESLVLMEPLLDDTTRPYIYYLFQGRTGDTVKKIQQIQCTPQGVLQICEQEIIKLTHQAEGYFFFNSRQRVFNQISCLGKLKSILAKPGYRINSALTELCGLYPEDYQILITTHAKLIAELIEIDKSIPDLQIGKTTIDVLGPLPFEEKLADLSKEDIVCCVAAEISYLRGQRYTQKPGFFVSTPSQDRCIALLTALKTALDADVRKPIAEFLNHLPVKDRELIVKQEKALLNELIAWQARQPAVRMDERLAVNL